MKNLTIISILLLVFVTTGCTGMQQRKTVEEDVIAQEQRDLEAEELAEQEAAANLKFEDIPVPKGFLVMMKNSFVFVNNFVRVGIVEYVGASDVNMITLFFKEQMPELGWTLVNSIEYSKSVMNFEKEEHTCTIVIEEYGRNKVKFTVAAGPRK